MNPDLQAALARGELTLFCGAGVSRSAGALDWQQLLQLMLYRLFETTVEAKHKGRTSAYYATVYSRAFPKSPIVIARHLKRHFGIALNDRIVGCLYCNPQTHSKLIEAIGRLCDQSECASPLRSIVSFNFDDLLENELSRRGLSFVVIDKAGTPINPEKVALYHPHGFLPRNDNERQKRNIVFSEDDYHEQFGNNFGWPTLCQLHRLSTTTCLLVGLSLADPNLRRLLDASRLQESPQSARHHIIFKRFTRDDMYRRHPGVGLADELVTELLSLVHLMEERDALSLGLNVVWVDSYDEIPSLIDSIAQNVPHA